VFICVMYQRSGSSTSYVFVLRPCDASIFRFNCQHDTLGPFAYQGVAPYLPEEKEDRAL
jgi:hypothetical protein